MFVELNDQGSKYLVLAHYFHAAAKNNQSVIGHTQIENQSGGEVPIIVNTELSESYNQIKAEIEVAAKAGTIPTFTVVPNGRR